MARSKEKTIVISPQAKQDIESVLKYLQENWNQKTTDNFLLKLQTFYTIVSTNPRLFGFFNKSKNIRSFVLSRQQVIYYRNRKIY